MCERKRQRKRERERDCACVRDRERMFVEVSWPIKEIKNGLAQLVYLTMDNFCKIHLRELSSRGG